LSPLTLAFVGDGVYDLLVREYLVRQANRPVGELNKVKVAMVNCRSQAQFAAKLMPHLTEKETAVYKRGRNAAPKSTAKNGTVAEYHSATGLECLFGYLHLIGEQARVEELFGLIVGLVFGNDKSDR
ncbi:MAG: ribonuclease III, partial [Ruminococcus sp.]|nr:ribonuclease III [Ruminococcus sp.]